MDFTRDSSKRTWIKLASQVTVPDYVKAVVALDMEDLTKIASAEFAYPAVKMYPVGSPGDTWLSAMYFHVSPPAMKKASLDAIGGSIRRAAAIYGIVADVDKAIAELSGQEKSASYREEDTYGWIVKDASGDVVARRYCIADSRGVSKAASYFDQYRLKYPFDVRRQVAKFIVKKANHYHIPLESIPPSVLREAGYGVPHLANLSDEIERRSLLCKDADVKAVFNNIGTVLSVATAAELLQGLDKVAETIDYFDRLVGLDKEYGRGILSPSDLVYSVPLTEASREFDHAVKLAAYVFDVRALAGLGKKAFACMGSEFGSAICDARGAVVPSQLRTELEKLSARDRHILEAELRIL